MTTSSVAKPPKDSRLVHGLDNYILLILLFPVAVISFVTIKLVWSLLRPSELTQNEPIMQRGQSPADECPICMETISFGIITNCRHTFCAHCFCRHWKRTLYARQIICPMCRGHVKILTRHFTDAEVAATDETRAILDKDIDMFNRWHSGLPVPFLQRVRDVPTLVYCFIQHLLSGESTTVLLQSRVLLLGLGAMLYVLSPFDLIPEVVAGLFGLIDDVLILLLFGVHVYAIYRATAVQR